MPSSAEPTPLEIVSLLWIIAAIALVLVVFGRAGCECIGSLKLEVRDAGTKSEASNE